MLNKRTPVYLATIQIISTLVDMYYINVVKWGRTLRGEKKESLKILFPPQSGFEIILILLVQEVLSNQETKIELLKIMIRRKIDKMNEDLKQSEDSQNNNDGSELLKKLLPLTVTKTESCNVVKNDAKDSVQLLSDKIEADIENATFEIVEDQQQKTEKDALTSNDQRLKLNDDKIRNEDSIKNNRDTTKQQKISRPKTKKIIITKKIISKVSKSQLRNIFIEVHEYMDKDISEVEITNLLSKFSEHEDKFDNQTIDVDTFEPTIWKGELTVLIYLFDKLRSVNSKSKTPIIVFQENIHDQISFYFLNKFVCQISSGTLKTSLSAFKKTEKRKDFDEFYNVMISNL